jgi:hypothetical protein
MKQQEKTLTPVRIIPDPDSIDDMAADLRSLGYQLKFRREATCFRCFEISCGIAPDGFNIDEYCHFEDSSNTDRERILFAVSSTQGSKGSW